MDPSWVRKRFIIIYRPCKILEQKKATILTGWSYFRWFVYQRIKIPTSRHIFLKNDSRHMKLIWWLVIHLDILLMKEIRPTTWHVWNIVNNGINYISTGAKFLPSWHISWPQNNHNLSRLYVQFFIEFLIVIRWGAQQKKLVPCTTNFSFITIEDGVRCSVAWS